MSITQDSSLEVSATYSVSMIINIHTNGKVVVQDGIFQMAWFLVFAQSVLKNNDIHKQPFLKSASKLWLKREDFILTHK